MRQTPKGQTMRHTPGPWRISGCRADKDHLLIEHGDNETKSTLIAMLYHDEHRLPMDANARLIAAAPETAAERDRLKGINAELLAALKKAEEVSELMDDLARYEASPQPNHQEVLRLQSELDVLRDVAATLRRQALAHAEGRP